MPITAPSSHQRSALSAGLAVDLALDRVPEIGFGTLWPRTQWE
jgi:hypothetical protein